MKKHPDAICMWMHLQWLLIDLKFQRISFKNSYLVGSPGIAIGFWRAFSAEESAVPDDLLRPGDVVQHVSIVEAVQVVLSRCEQSSLTVEHLIPRAEQNFALKWIVLKI